MIKFMVFNIRYFKKYLLILLLAVCLAAFVMVFSSKVIDVWSENRQIPIYSVELYDKKAAITFDCAWGDSDIPSIMDTLKKEGIKATFFIVGQWAEKYPDTVRLIAREGHDIANHSYSHLRMGTLDRGKIKSEILKCGTVLESLSGQTIDLFRAPYGDYNSNVVTTAKSLGYYTIQWNVDSLDWRTGISKQEISDRIYRKIKPGSIILFHNDTPHTANILPEIITNLKDKGYVFLPVSKLIMRDDYIIDFDGSQKRKDK